MISMILARAHDTLAHILDFAALNTMFLSVYIRFNLQRFLCWLQNVPMPLRLCPTWIAPTPPSFPSPRCDRSLAPRGATITDPFLLRSLHLTLFVCAKITCILFRIAPSTFEHQAHGLHSHQVRAVLPSPAIQLDMCWFKSQIKGKAVRPYYISN